MLKYVSVILVLLSLSSISLAEDDCTTEKRIAILQQNVVELQETIDSVQKELDATRALLTQLQEQNEGDIDVCFGLQCDEIEEEEEEEEDDIDICFGLVCEEPDDIDICFGLVCEEKE